VGLLIPQQGIVSKLDASTSIKRGLRIGGAGISRCLSASSVLLCAEVRKVSRGARLESGCLWESVGQSRESLRSSTPGGAATVRERSCCRRLKQTLPHGTGSVWGLHGRPLQCRAPEIDGGATGPSALSGVPAPAGIRSGRWVRCRASSLCAIKRDGNKAARILGASQECER